MPGRPQHSCQLQSPPPHQRNAGARGQITIGSLLAACAGVLVAGTLRGCLGPGAVPPHNVQAPIEGMAASNPAQTAASPATEMQSGRTALAAEESSEDLDCRTFDEFVSAIVELGMKTSELRQQGTTESAEDNDDQARELFERLMGTIPDAAEQALQRLSETPQVDVQTTLDTIAAQAFLRRRVLSMTLSFGCQLYRGLRMSAADRESQDHASPDRLDHLVSAMLTTMPASEELALELTQGHLANRPYLGAAHELQVLELVAMSGEGSFPVEAATVLLTTLWNNLVQTGARTSDDLAGLALLLLHDGNATERKSAVRRLLLDDRFRLVILQQLIQDSDMDLAREVAMVAAQDLPPEIALDTLAETNSLTEGFSAPYVWLGQRAPALMEARYDELLAADLQPKLREMLMTGAGLMASSGVDFAQRAFANDPDPAVRTRSVFLISARGDPEVAEATFHRALDDPAFRTDPERLAQLVMAMENLARSGDCNAMARVAQRLQACGTLPTYAQTRLQDLLARYLPGSTENGSGR